MRADTVDRMCDMARIRVAMLVGLCLWPAPQLAQSPRAAAEKPLAVVAEFDGIIHPIAAEYIDEAITQADASGADVVVIVLRTPGGLLDSTRDIVSRMIASRAPVVVFVGPSGARAASAGFILTLAADVAVMAPGTHIGAAHPVSGTGEPTDTITADKGGRGRGGVCAIPGRSAETECRARGGGGDRRAARSPIAKRSAPRRR